MRTTIRKTLISGAVTALALSVCAVGAPAAHAGSGYGCLYPYACVYNDSTLNSGIIARFRDVTSSWQYLRRPETRFAVYNTRNDDVVYLLINYGAGDTTSCIRPNGSIGSLGTLKGIRISSRSTC